MFRYRLLDGNIISQTAFYFFFVEIGILKILNFYYNDDVFCAIQVLYYCFLHSSNLFGDLMYYNCTYTSRKHFKKSDFQYINVP